MVIILSGDELYISTALMYYLHMETEERLTELETRMVYAESTIDELNKIVALQGQEIESLRRYSLELKNKLNELKEAGGDSDMPHEKPPHY